MLPYFKIVDLIHTLDSTIPAWNGNCGYKSIISSNYSDCSTEVKFCVHSIELQAGIGTHVDAPAHCVEGGECVASLKLENLIAPCVVIDGKTRQPS